MNWSQNLNLFLMLAFRVAACAAFVRFASHLLKGFNHERGAITQALENTVNLVVMQFMAFDKINLETVLSETYSGR